MLSASQPVLILTVTGTLEFATAVSIICFTSSKFNNNLLPSPFFTTFGAGHPMLISTISANSLTYLLAYAIASTSLPNICTANGFSLSQVFSNNFVFSSLYKSAFALTISVYTSPASFSLQINLNGRSVMPAIGAKNILFSSSTFPIFKIYLI